jgi:hypothetical protein
VIGAGPLGQRRFLAVEEDQLDRVRVLPILQHARQLEQHRRARSAVVRTDEAELPEQLRVEVARDQDALGVGAGDLDDDVGHLRGAERRFGRELLERRREAERFQLIGDVGASLLVAGRTGGAGADGHELADVLEGARRIEPGPSAAATPAAASRNCEADEYRNRGARPAHAVHPRAVIGT